MRGCRRVSAPQFFSHHHLFFAIGIGLLRFLRSFKTAARRLAQAPECDRQALPPCFQSPETSEQSALNLPSKIAPMLFASRWTGAFLRQRADWNPGIALVHAYHLALPFPGCRGRDFPGQSKFHPGTDRKRTEPMTGQAFAGHAVGAIRRLVRDQLLFSVELERKLLTGLRKLPRDAPGRSDELAGKLRLTRDSRHREMNRAAINAERVKLKGVQTLRRDVDRPLPGMMLISAQVNLYA